MRLREQFASTFIDTCAGSVIEKDFFDLPAQKVTRLERVNYAGQAQGLGPKTKVVTITAGANEAWAAGIRDYGVLQSWRLITPAEYGRRITPAIRRVQELAPNARVWLVGYPHIVDSDNRLCAIDTPRERTGTPVRVVVSGDVMRNYMGAMNTAMRELSPQLGTEYVDIARVFEGHGSCQPQENRWVKNAVDHPSQDQVMMWHLNDRVVAAQAQAIMQQVRQKQR